VKALGWLRHGKKSKVTLLVGLYAMKAYRESRGTAPFILNFSTRWWGVANFTLQPLFSRGKKPVPTD
jgi:hypothetical protein